MIEGHLPAGVVLGPTLLEEDQELPPTAWILHSFPTQKVISVGKLYKAHLLEGNRGYAHGVDLRGDARRRANARRPSSASLNSFS